LAATTVLAAVGLTACGGSSLSPTGSTSPLELVGPTWRLVRIQGQPVIDGTAVSAEFTSEARVAGKAGCNQYSGGARAEDGGRLVVGPLASTRMACSPQAVMDQETRYLTALQAAESFAIDGSQLRLGPTAGSTTLVFTSQ
jgi:heat shock protein HslJ